VREEEIIRVLLIEDDEDDFVITRDLLSEIPGKKFTVEWVKTYEEGLAIIKGARDRYDGVSRPPIPRNPWNEIEAGDHYVRSLASWGVYVALCGSRVDLVEGTLSFDPALNQDNFSAFFICGKAWGIYEQRIDPGSGERREGAAPEARTPSQG